MLQPHTGARVIIRKQNPMLTQIAPKGLSRNMDHLLVLDMFITRAISAA